MTGQTKGGFSDPEVARRAGQKGGKSTNPLKGFGSNPELAKQVAIKKGKRNGKD